MVGDFLVVAERILQATFHSQRRRPSLTPHGVEFQETVHNQTHTVEFVLNHSSQ
jgi:hypothetical protein